MRGVVRRVAGGGVEHGGAAVAAVDNDADAGDGERGFGDGGGEDDAAAAGQECLTRYAWTTYDFA